MRLNMDLERSIFNLQRNFLAIHLQCSLLRFPSCADFRFQFFMVSDVFQTSPEVSESWWYPQSSSISNDGIFPFKTTSYLTAEAAFRRPRGSGCRGGDSMQGLCWHGYQVRLDRIQSICVKGRVSKSFCVERLLCVQASASKKFLCLQHFV